MNINRTNYHENDSEKNSAGSNLSLDENDDHGLSITEDAPLPISDVPEDEPQKCECKNESVGNSVAKIQEKNFI